MYVLGLTGWSDRATENANFQTGEGQRNNESRGKDKDYEIEIKLTGCKDYDFTCDNGQCIRMEQRCDQLPKCEDKSDEQNCRLLVLEFAPECCRRKKIERKQASASSGFLDIAKSG